MKRIYADNSATTQVRQEVIDAMTECMSVNYGNPSSLHTDGRKAKAILNIARENIASIINAKPNEIVFTSGGTESNNLVISGIAKYIERATTNKKKHIITSKIEHAAIKEPLENLEKSGWTISWLNVNKYGEIDLDELKSTINENTALVSIIHTNNEIGTIQDTEAISSICKKNNVLFHSDIVQAFCKIKVNADLFDFLSFSSHKIHGSKGVGGLYIKEGNEKHLSSLVLGGGQESSIRPGTENLPGIVGFGTAAKLMLEEMDENKQKLVTLQKDLYNELSSIDNLVFTGSKMPNRLPGHVSFCLKNLEGESIVLQLDLKGISVSSGSACSTVGNKTEIKPSHVVEALNLEKEYNKGSIRISLSKNNSNEDIKKISISIKEIVNNLKKLNVN